MLISTFLSHRKGCGLICQMTFLQRLPLARQVTKKGNTRARAKAKAKGSHLKESLGLPEKALLKAKGNFMSEYQKGRECLKEARARGHFLKSDHTLSCMEPPLQAHQTTRTLKALLPPTH